MGEYDANQAAQDAWDARRVSDYEGRVFFYVQQRAAASALADEQRAAAKVWLLAQEAPRAEKTMTAKLFLLLPYVFFVAVFAVAWLAIGFLLDRPLP